MITHKMIKNGYERRVITLESSVPNDGIVARIGEYWFYFGAHEAEEYDDPEAFKKDIHKNQIINDIYTILKDWLHDENMIDEYRYYEAVLKEAGCDK